MDNITVACLTDKELNDMNICSWNPWECEQSTFDWQYEQEEWCYLFEGRVMIKTETGYEVEIKKGDLVKFPKGLKCTWNVFDKVRKAYIFQ